MSSLGISTHNKIFSQSVLNRYDYLPGIKCLVNI